MDETAFTTLADAELARIEAAIEGCGAELELEIMPGGVFELEFDDGSKAVINRHTAAQEIWLAAKSGGFHFAPRDGRWVSARDGSELYATLSRVISEQSGETVELRPD
ncbi:MAG: iron donor protein CyaY [Azoarcus sp.]|nr:iron donor protein CyaY [Azoarcus sp.]